MVADSFKFEEIDGVVWEVNCSMVTESGVPINIGANASAEGEDAEEGANDPTSETFIDVVKSARLCETGFSKKDYITYIKGYMKKIESHLQEKNPGRVAAFKEGAARYVKKVLEHFDDFSFYLGENCNMEGMVVLMDYREDGTTPYCVFWIDGMLGEKY